MHSSRELGGGGGGGGEKHAQMMCGTTTKSIEPERLLDKGTEWIAGRWTESVGLMYSVDCGIMDLPVSCC